MCVRKLTAITGLLFFLQLQSIGQTIFNNFHRNTVQLLELKYIPKEKISLPAQAIEVLDARFDQSRVGIKNFFDDHTFQTLDIIFPDSFSGYLQQKLQSWISFNSSSPDKLIVLVKNFRLTEDITDLLVKGKRKKILFQLSAAIYLQRNDQCYKIGLIDKWFSNSASRNNIRISNDEQERLVTNILFHELLNLNMTINESAKSYTRNEIEEAIRLRFDMPVLKEKPQKGVYKTFEDFIQNKPAFSHFNRMQLKNGLDILVDSAGNRIHSKSAWGFCNGEQVFYFFGDNFYELKKRSGMYELKASHKIDKNVTVNVVDELFRLAYISASTRNNFKLSGMPAYIEMDMETGKLCLEEIIGMHKLLP